MYLMYSEASSDEYHIAATSPISEDLPAVGVNFKFVAHGPGHKNDLTMKKLIVHQLPDAAAEQLQPTD